MSSLTTKQLQMLTEIYHPLWMSREEAIVWISNTYTVVDHLYVHRLAEIERTQRVEPDPCPPSSSSSLCAVQYC